MSSWWCSRGFGESVGPRGAALLLPVALAWAACSEETPPGVAASASSGGAGASGSGASSGAGAGVPHPDNDPECTEYVLFDGSCAPAGLHCLYSTPCNPEGCEAYCVAGHYVWSCEPCDGPVPECPSEPPAHATACDSDMGELFSCFYDDCGNNEFAAARCDGRSWEVNHWICSAAPGCFGFGEDALQCSSDSLCVDSNVDPLCTAHPVWDCPPNPCGSHQPLSCACAGLICGPYLECVEAKGGWVTCDPPAAGPNPPELLAASDGYDLVIDDEHAYWLSGEVRRVALAGGAYETFSAVASGHLAIDSNYLYVGDGNAAALRRISLTTQVEDELATSLPYLAVLGVNSQIALWASSAELLTIPIGGGSPTTFASGSTGGIATLDETHAFFESNNGLVAAPLGGGSPTILTTLSVDGIALDESHAYLVHWGPQHLAKVVKVPKTGGVPVELASNQYEPHDIAVDETHVYFPRDDGLIMRVPKQGGAVEVFVEGFAEVHEIAVDSTHVYWISQHPWQACQGVFKKAK